MDTMITFSALPKSRHDVSLIDCISAILSMLYALLSSLSNKIYSTRKNHGLYNIASYDLGVEGGMTEHPLSSWELKPNLNRP